MLLGSREIATLMANCVKCIASAPIGSTTTVLC